ncbi:LacI family DNA-binding transcriptional regulator [Wenxinia marina]|uniref:Transcriptional regulator, LacI family n=1 Tax=Wenxinia marina DSM 24838 TaxID=1123501 RepID=A0A0D0P9Q5_9RHOB|nr:LacI family DNA-binding transcriptional regulator [Wenxinia marina]KIQ68236.1 transcriptional regulator, LacI family [Wenxinia marina DSM 24838]GGL76963.1 alanine racemase [Wenxinia marina]
MASAPTRVRLSDVAAAAEVSVATASKALNGTGRMTDETRDRVRQAAEALGFRPNAMARALSSQRSLTVGLITNDSYGRFTLPVMSGLSAALVDEGISVLMCNVEDDPDSARRHLDTMLDKQVDGLVVTGRRIDTALPLDLSGVTIPVVYAFTKGPDDAVTLTADDAQGAGLATEWLGSLGRGRLAHVTGPEEFAAARLRAGAFAAVAGPGAPVLHGDWSEAWGHEAVARLWAAGDGPDGIFCGSDQIARGVVDALRERGVDVPGQVSVVGFDNWQIVAAATRPPLTTVDMGLNGIGREAGRLVRALVEGEAVAPGVRRLPCRLVVRGSCGGTPPA